MSDLLFLIDLRLFFLWIHHDSLLVVIVDRLIVLHLIVLAQIVVDLFFGLLRLYVVLVVNVLIASVVLGAVSLHNLLVLIMCAAVVLFGVLWFYELMLLIVFGLLLHVLVVSIVVDDLDLLGVVHVVALHLAEVLFRSLIALKVVLALILICVVLLHLVLTNEILLILHFQLLNFLISYRLID